MSRRKPVGESAVPGADPEDQLLLAAATTLDRAVCALEDPDVAPPALGGTRHELTTALRGTVALLFDRLDDRAA